ncbi:MAG: Uma2 family endonuclease [Lachnospiraceae bacterium]|nr:Uma2 family endonuclease [Lachnospiraceae bacterium]
MTIEEMKQKKKEYGYTYEKIAELSGVPLGTVQKIFCGVTESPRYDTLQALEHIFRESASGSDSRVSEAVQFYRPKEQEGYTLEDYYALPEERRAELIDGVFYDMSSPRTIHQLICSEIHVRLRRYISEKKGSCIPFTAPMDVQLDCDDRTMVQPDVMVICDRRKIIDRCIYGAPDFIAEVLSQATKRRDTVTKLGKYMEAGVREYWVIDPYMKKVIVYDFEHDEYPMIYGFDSVIPVGIFEGDCRIDFNEIFDYVRFLYEDPELL